MGTCATDTVVVGSDSWQPATFDVSDIANPVHVAEVNALRRGVLVVNLASSAGTVWLCDRSVASTSTGGRTFPLAPGEGVTINTTADVWCLADRTGAAATVKVVQEFGAA